MSEFEHLDRRVKKTKQALKESFISLLSEKGFQAVTVQDITKRADVNRATFYSHYQDKHDMLEQMIAEILQEFTDAINSTPVDSKSQAITKESRPNAAFVRMFEQIQKHADFYNVMLSKKGIPGFWRQMYGIIRECFYQRRLKLQPDDQQLIVPKDILSSFTSSSYLGMIMYWLESGMVYTPEYMATQLTLLTSLGPSAAAGIKK
ncbi:AcrR family transcriptional regulator [Bacillus fengqiuensis]|nr:AcrR family transcriptional regulator [Bacillus fengqiuensis]